MFLLEITKALAKENVQFAIAGGYAVALHGAVRGTIDVDLVLAFTEANYLGCEKALQAIGLVPKLPVTAQEVFQFRHEYITKRNLKAWSFYDPNNPTRLVDIVITFKKRKLTRKWVVVERQRIPILNKTDLIEMKRKAGRPQDVADVKALERL